MAAGHLTPRLTGTLPRSMTSLVGRDREIAEISSLLQRDDVRLVSLTGPGGIGKTRLAIETASVISHHYPDGVSFVPLAGLTQPQNVLPAIAQGINVSQRGDIPLVEQIAASIGDCRLLVVVDNFEHVREAAPDLAALLARCHGMNVLVTSRVRLRISGEWEYGIPPLALANQPDLETSGDNEYGDAMQLFVQRASAADFGFELTEENLRAIKEICRRLGGMPLAIELAAARVRFLPPHTMLEHLQRRMTVLSGGGPDLPDRHRTMSSAIDWSYALLTTVQQRVFRSLAVFVATFSLDAAAEVLHRALGFQIRDIEAAIESLIDHSLVRVSRSTGPFPRFSILEPLRDFALDVLETSCERELMREAHAQYFLEFVERGAPFLGPDRVAKVEEVERELANIYAALAWAIEQSNTRAALWFVNALTGAFWRPRGRVHEQLVWLARVIALPGPGLEAERAGAYVGIAMAEARVGNFDAALAAAEKAMACARAVEDVRQIAWVHTVMGMICWRTSRFADSRTHLKSALALAEDLDDLFLLGWTHHNFAILAMSCGEAAEATQHFSAAHAALEELRDPWETADLDGNLAFFLETQGEFVRSSDLHRHALQEYVRLGDVWLLQFSFFDAGGYATEIGMWEQAVRLHSAMEQLKRLTGSAVPFGYEDMFQTLLASEHAHLEEREFASAWDEGAVLTIDAAVVVADQVFEAWGKNAQAKRDSTLAPHGLSPRELEVLHLVAAGKSNAQIGETLFISVPTVKVHVRSIMGKLGLDSRTALAAFAIRHQLD